MSFTKYQHPSGFCYYIKILNSNSTLVTPTKEHEDDDIPKIFVDFLTSDIKEIYYKYYRKKKVVMKREEV